MAEHESSVRVASLRLRVSRCYLLDLMPYPFAQICTKCKIEKDSTQFHRNTLTASGLVSRCKQCIAEADAKRCVSVISLLFTTWCEHLMDPGTAVPTLSVGCHTVGRCLLAWTELLDVSLKVWPGHVSIITPLSIQHSRAYIGCLPHRSPVRSSEPIQLCRRYDRMKVKEGRAAPQDVTKQCSQCGEVKPGTCFSPNTTSPDGLRSNCKDCQSKYLKKAPATLSLDPKQSPLLPSGGVRISCHTRRLADHLYCGPVLIVVSSRPYPTPAVTPHRHSDIHAGPRLGAGGSGRCRWSSAFMMRLTVSPRTGSRTRCVVSYQIPCGRPMHFAEVSMLVRHQCWQQRDVFIWLKAGIVFARQIWRYLKSSRAARQMPALTWSAVAIAEDQDRRDCNMMCQVAQGLQTEQQLAEAVQRAATQQTTSMPVILYEEHGQPLIQPYLQLQQQYEVRCFGDSRVTVGMRSALGCAATCVLGKLIRAEPHALQ